MSMFICNQCSELTDSDYDECITDPSDDTELICQECAEEMEVSDGPSKTTISD